MAANNLSQLKPKLRPYRISHDGSRIIIEDRERPRHGSSRSSTSSAVVSLPASQEPVVALLDGLRTVKEIIEHLTNTMGHVSFSAVLSTLQALDEAGLFAEALGLTAAGAAAAPTGRPEAFVMRPLFQATIARRLRGPGLAGPLGLVLLLAATGAIAGVAIDTILYWASNASHFSTRGFFLLRDATGILSYARALPALLLATSALLVSKGLARATLMLLGNGQIFNLRLKLLAFGVGVDVSDVSTQSMSRTRAAICFVGVALANVAIAAVFPSYVHNPDLVRTFETLAVLLTLLELDPYRRSDLTVLIDRVFRDTDSRRMTAYLRNRALFSAATGSRGFGGESRLVAYSCVALLWTVGFATFALDLLSANYPSLFVAAQSAATMQERVSAGVLLALLTAIFGTLFFDLASTIARNVLFPLLTPYLRLLKSVNTKDVTDFDRGDMAKRLQEITFFEDLAPLSIREMVATAKLKRCRRGTRLIIQGDPGNELFVLLDGAVGVHHRDETGLTTRVCGLTSGAVFGEVALIRDCTRTADVVAEDDLQALVVEKPAFKKLVEGSKYIDDFGRILDKIALGHYLSSVPLFREMPAETLGIFRERGYFERRKVGEIVIEEGGKDRSLFLVLRGRLDVSKNGKTVAELKQGDFFGEIALLSSQPRTATVKALDECLLLRLDANPFWDAISGSLALAAGLEVVAERRGAALGAPIKTR